MRYTIWSHGRLVGETDLAFARVIDEMRFGWFVPTAEGEQVMAVATAMSPALRPGRGQQAEEPEIPEVRGSAYLADLAEAAHHVSALELELRDIEGRVVPTEEIGFQDTHILLELAREAMAEHEQADWQMEDDPDELFGGVTLDELEEGEFSWREDFGAPDGPYVPDAEDDDGSSRGERYQVIVRLADPASIP